MYKNYIQIRNKIQNAQKSNYPREEPNCTFSVQAFNKLECHSWEDEGGCFQVWEEYASNQNHMAPSKETVTERRANLALQSKSKLEEQESDAR